VSAGPASGVDVGPALGGGLLRRLAGGQAVMQACYDSVLARVLPDSPTASALSQARARLADDSMDGGLSAQQLLMWGVSRPRLSYLAPRVASCG